MNQRRRRLEAREAVSATEGPTTPALVAASATVDEEGQVAALAARGTLIDAARQQAACKRPTKTVLN